MPIIISIYRPSCSMIVISKFIACDRQVNLCVYTYFL